MTNNKIEKLKNSDKSAGNQIEYSDVVCVGLKLIHSNLTGRKVFHHRYTVNGKKKSMKVGEFPAVTVELARDIANGNKALLAQGLDPVTERKKQANRLTFKQFSEEVYLPEARLRKRSWKDDERKLSSDMYPAFGEKPLTEISRVDISKYINMILARTSKSTANRHRALLLSIFNMAIDQELLEKNCVAHIKKYEESSEHGRSLTNEELARLLTALDNAPQQVSALAVKFLLATGMRKSECLKLKWENIDLTQKLAKLELENTKGKRARNVPLNPSAIQTLQQLENYRKASNPYVFPSEGGTHLTTVRKTFESCKKAAGIENFRLHDCRHTFCSILAESGTSLYMIQNLVGHRSPIMTQRYSHLNTTALQDTSKIVSDRLSSATAHH